MNFAFCGLLLMLVSCSMSVEYVQHYYKSCKEIKTKLPASLSGLYDILVDDTKITVYCEMNKDGGGFTFIPRQAVQKGKLKSLVKQLFKDRTQVLLRFQKKDGLQPFTLIKQLPSQSGKPLTVLKGSYTGFSKPVNSIMGEYIFLGISPYSTGFVSNKKEVTYKLCGKYPTSSYFAFFPNHREVPINRYNSNNLVYERSGLAVNWRGTGIPSYGHRQLPNDFFFLTEMHFGGCGCYTTSDRWTDAFGTAIGLR